MGNNRYTQFILPMDRYVRRLKPRARRLLALAEGGLLVSLVCSVIFYLQG